MLKVFGLCACFANLNIVRCDLILPQVFIPELKLYPQNPPKLPVLCLSEEKFSLPQFCQNASEWEDADMSLKILTDFSEPDPERSTFASFINLIKFILIKEELTCLDAISGPIIQVQRPEGKIFKDTSKIRNDIETALSNKPKQRVQPVAFYDNADISNLIPIWRPRTPYKRKNVNAIPLVEELKTNSTCACPEPLRNVSPVTIIVDNLNPIRKEASKTCSCAQCQSLPLQPNCKLQNLPSTNIKPIVLGCGGKCNLCQRITSPLMAGCPKLTTPVLADCSKLTTPISNGYPKLSSSMLAGCPKLASVAPGAALGCGCPKTNMILGGCPYGNPVMSCPKCGLTGCGCHKQAVSLVQSKAIPFVDCYGNLMKQVKTTYLVPYTMSQIVA